MPEPEGVQGFLLELAAEAIGPVVGGCVGALVAGPAGVVVGAVVGKGCEKAINYFGPRIAEAWIQRLAARPLPEQQAALEQLAGMSTDEARRLAEAAVARAAPNASPADKKAAAAYLSAIPAAVQRSLVPDPRSGRLSCPPGTLAQGSRGLLQLLPQDLPPFQAPCDLPGTPYRLQRLLGAGGFGAVYEAGTASLQYLRFAIKFCLDPQMVVTLKQERDLLARLQAAGAGAWSDRVVRLYGFDLDYPKPYLVYEMVSGGDLAGHLAARREQTGGGVPPAEALRLVVQVAQGLSFAHGHGLVHRDLKPANVLVDGDRIKLADFGIGAVAARDAIDKSRLAGSSGHRLSAAEQSDLFRGSGTLLYMCREQRRGDAPDPRHDIYSLGVMWYQLLIGDVTQELHAGWARELEVRHKVPAKHIDAIRQCVGLLEERPANGQAMITLLKTVAQPVAAPPPVPKPAPLPAARPAPPDEALRRAREEAERRLREADSQRRRREAEADSQRRREARRAELHEDLADQVARAAWGEAGETVADLLRRDPADAEALRLRDVIAKELTVRRARSLVRPPAVIMIILSLLSGTFCSLMLIGFLASSSEKSVKATLSTQPQKAEAEARDAGPDKSNVDRAVVEQFLGWSCLTSGVCALGAIVAAIQMLRLRTYWLAVAGCFLMMAATWLACVLGVPAGIWSLIVLLQADVRNSFLS